MNAWLNTISTENLVYSTNKDSKKCHVRSPFAKLQTLTKRGACTRRSTRSPYLNYPSYETIESYLMSNQPPFQIHTHKNWDVVKKRKRRHKQQGAHQRLCLCLMCVFVCVCFVWCSAVCCHATKIRGQFRVASRGNRNARTVIGLPSADTFFDAVDVVFVGVNKHRTATRVLLRTRKHRQPTTDIVEYICRRGCFSTSGHFAQIVDPIWSAGNIDAAQLFSSVMKYTVGPLYTAYRHIMCGCVCVASRTIFTQKISHQRESIC